MASKTIFDFSALDANGNDVCLDKYKGTACLIVNFSTKDPACEQIFTLLSSLYKTFHNETKNALNILLFPCFQFGPSESPSEILAFFERSADRQVGDVFAEIEVNGAKCIELYKFLKQVKRGNCGGFINSNFTMFLTDRNGVPVERIGANVHPYVLEDLVEQYCK